MPDTVASKEELVARGAELMARVTAITRPLSTELAALPLEAMVCRAHSAIHVASLGVTIGQCLSWLTEDRQDEITAGMMDLLRGIRVLLRGARTTPDIIFPAEFGALRREVEIYHQAVVERIWGASSVLPFRHARR